MAVLPILEYPDPRLRRVAEPVEVFDAELEAFIEDLTTTLYDSGGIGLAGPQTGDVRRVLVMDLSEDRDTPEVYINPEILKRDVPGLVEESCLSVPEIVENVIRHTQIRVRACDVRGETFERDLSDMYAVCLQHELDHLDGMLFVDRLSLFKRLRIRATLGRRPVAAAS